MFWSLFKLKSPETVTTMPSMSPDQESRVSHPVPSQAMADFEIRQLLDVANDAFARNRLRLTGRYAGGACELAARSRPLPATPQ